MKKNKIIENTINSKLKKKIIIKTKRVEKFDILIIYQK